MAEEKTKATLKQVEQDIQLAAQAELALDQDNDDLFRFEKMLASLQHVEGLIDHTEVLQSAQEHIQEAPEDLNLLREETMKASLKVEEAAQLYHLRHMALLKSQISMALTSSNIVDEDLEDAQKEVFLASHELIEISRENQLLEQKVEECNSQLQEVQDKIKALERENGELRNASGTQLNGSRSRGEASERITKLEAQVDKISGRYDFTRFLTQLLLMAGKADFTASPQLGQLFELCGEPGSI